MEANRPLIMYEEDGMKLEWLGVAGTLVGIISAYVGYQTGIKKESKAEGRSTGVLQTDITYIKNNIDKILDEQKIANEAVQKLTERIVTIEVNKVSTETFNKLSETVARLDERVCAHFKDAEKGGV